MVEEKRDSTSMYKASFESLIVDNHRGTDHAHGVFLVANSVYPCIFFFLTGSSPFGTTFFYKPGTDSFLKRLTVRHQDALQAPSRQQGIIKEISFDFNRPRGGSAREGTHRPFRRLTANVFNPDLFH